MSSFYTAENEFSKLILEYNFIPLYSMWNKNTIILSRKIGHQNIAYCHIIISANGSGGISVNLWIAPLECPDARLDSNSAAFLIKIGEEWEDNPDFLQLCQSRIINVFNGLDRFENTIEQELNNPSLLSNAHQIRMKNYLLYLAVLKLIKESLEYPEIKKEILKVIEKKAKSLTKINKKVKEAIINNQAKVKDPKLFQFIDEKQRAVISLSETITDYIYIELALKS
ncbi:Imm25 family immunity protein [Flavobacterium sp.]|uniref:Imm25 family immunity protein n=1 Tax=Flavobacterium sp. TaxID=239 RepID=UPI0031E23E17